MMAGCLVGYFVGAKSAPLARRLVGPAGLARAAHLADRYGVWAIVLSRPIPVLAEATVVFAGLVRAPLGRFMLLTALSNLGIAAGYAAIGAFSMRLDSFLLAFVGAMAVPGIALLVAKGGPIVDSLSALRVDLARRSKWNIGYLVAGLVSGPLRRSWGRCSRWSRPRCCG